MAATKPSLTHEALKAIIDQAVAEARAARDTQDKAKESNHSKIAAAFKRAGIRLSICEAVIVDDLAVVNFRLAETARNCLSSAILTIQTSSPPSYAAMSPTRSLSG
jgi:hypothetical protein